MIWVPVALLLAATIYWLLVITEGTYLGPRVVALLYDWTASRYNAIKQTQFVHEQLFLGIPLAERLEPLVRPRVLDVATGTGRIPLALLGGTPFHGTVLAGDRSLGMLTEAQIAHREWQGQATFVQLDAADLPIADRSVDCVTCLEALEFMSDGRAVLREVWRVLRPGGVALLTNRVGPQARFFPFRIARRGSLERQCAALGFENVETQAWQVDYDLVWAIKPEDRV